LIENINPPLNKQSYHFNSAIAKKRFSARNCACERLAKDYLSGSAIRQDYLETALAWISAREGIAIEDYMGQYIKMMQTLVR